MADKLQQGVNVFTTFVEGETPSAAKLNSIVAQLKNASQQLERAVGDIHGQSYPYSSATSARLSMAYGRSGGSVLSNAETRSLDIVNLARLVGPASALNPMIVGNDLEITEPVPSNVTEFSLRYPPRSTASVSFTKSGTGEAFENLKAVGAMITVGDYYVDGLGRVYTTQATDTIDPGTVTYAISRDSWFGGPNYEGGRFNVIPGPNQLSAGGTGCTISSPPDAQGRRTISLPTVTHAQFDVDMSSTSLSDADPNYGEQLTLPQVITTTYTSGELIPEGFVLLKNWTTGEVYDSAEYIYDSPTSLTIGSVDITTEVDRGDIFCIITVGTDITTAIDDLRRKSRHAHDRNFGEPMVPATSITDWTVGPWGSQGGFTKSNIEGNYAPQYLHRYGYHASENDWNDENVLRGHLVIGKSGASPGGYYDSSGLSYSLYFGDLLGPRLYNQSTAGYLKAPGSLNLESTGGSVNIVAADDIVLDADGGDVTIRGGLLVEYSTGDPHAAGTGVINKPAVSIEALAGHVDAINSAIAQDSVIAGPLASAYSTDQLPIWSIEENGSHQNGDTDGSHSYAYATTTSTGSVDNDAWVCPNVQFLYFSQQDVTFEATADAAMSQIDDVQHWQQNIDIPSYLVNQYVDEKGVNAILGYTIQVKSSHASFLNKWYTCGAGRFGTEDGGGEKIIAYLQRDDGTTSGNQIHICISAEGNASQAFHWERFFTSGDPVDSIAVDVKILLIVASAGTAGYDINP